MRDKRFISEHRGGLLTLAQHRRLMRWSCDCVEHGLGYHGGSLDARIVHALLIGRAWAEGNSSVGEARKASVALLQLARETNDPVHIALIRATGHAVATAHMADHCLGGALYVLKSVSLMGKSVDEERNWQMGQLPEDLSVFVKEAFEEKARHFRMRGGNSK